MSSSSNTSLGRRSFRRQLVMTVAAGMIGLAITASIATALVTTNRARDLLIAQGRSIAENLAEQSTLALLYGSGENAHDAVMATLSFPDVHRVSVFDLNGKTLIDEGHKDEKPLAFDLGPYESREESRSAKLFHDSDDAWYFAAPVYTGEESVGAEFPLLATDTRRRELVGYVYIVISKASLQAMRYNIFSNNIAIAFSFSLILLLVLHVSLSRLTQPLTALTGVMRLTEGGDTAARADESGPREFAQIAKTFNRMMLVLDERDKRLRQANEILESEVALRTRDLVYARDVALAAARHKTEFLANVTHELRTPLQAIIGYTDVVMERLSDADEHQCAKDLERVLTSAYHLLHLINDVLDLAKIEAGRMELQLEHTDPRRLLIEAEDTVKPLMERNDNRLVVNLDLSDEHVELDRGRLLQVLLNLMSNAGKFTESGEITVNVKQRPDLLTIEVRDNGIGISEDQQTIIFDQFRQSDGSATRRFDGTGLGLSITRQLCRLMGGDIEVRSKLGEGSAFTVTLPLPIQARAIND